MDTETNVQQKSSFATTFLWILLTFLIFYIMVTIIFRPNNNYFDVEDVTLDDLDRFMNSQTSVLYHHPDCPHCKKMLPVFKNLSPDFPSVRFITIDAAKNDIPFEEQIGAYPTIRIYNGKEIGGEMVGDHSSNDIKAKMKKYLNDVDDDNVLKQIQTFFKSLTKKRERNMNDKKEKKEKKELFKTTSSAF